MIFPVIRWMDGTEVRVSSCGREGVGEALPRLQYRRLLELIVGARDNVWATLSWLVQVTVAPTGTVICLAVKN